MSLTNLTKYSVDQLKEEIKKRLAEEDKIKQKLQEEEQLENYLKRPACAILGRAYSSGTLGDYTLASVTISGNSSRIYSFNAKVCSTVNTYFGNTFDWKSESELRNAVNILVKSYLANRLNDPLVIFELMGLACNFNRGQQGNPIAKKDYEEAVIERMKEFSDEEILACGTNSRLSHSSHLLQLVMESRGLVTRRKTRVVKS